MQPRCADTNMTLAHKFHCKLEKIAGVVLSGTFQFHNCDRLSSQDRSLLSSCFMSTRNNSCEFVLTPSCRWPSVTLASAFGSQASATAAFSRIARIASRCETRNLKMMSVPRRSSSVHCYKANTSSIDADRMLPRPCPYD